jgi:thiamine-phosphate pyrophosphorylase
MPAKEVRSTVLPRVHCITDLPFRDSPFGRENTLDLIEAVVCQGVDAVQVRAKQLADRDLYSFTRSVVDRLRGKAVTVIVNDRLDIALATGAHGIHLGLDDLPVAEARRLAPAGFLIGATCRSASHAAEARAQGADYVGVGPVYASTTKAGLPSAVGLATLRETAKVLPSIAISGINADRIPDVMAAGAYGVAVVAAISGAKHPELAAKEIVDAVLAA